MAVRQTPIQELVMPPKTQHLNLNPQTRNRREMIDRPSNGRTDSGLLNSERNIINPRHDTFAVLPLHASPRISDLLLGHAAGGISDVLVERVFVHRGEDDFQELAVLRTLRLKL